ncbi:hypothetical protein JNM05_12805 [bacterium]|nr:hypothetical protein [bacterium]
MNNTTYDGTQKRMPATGNKLLLLFLLAATCITGACYLIVRSEKYISNTNALSLAITVDIIFFIPLIYFLLIRKSSVPKITIIPVVFLALLAASLLLPSGDQEYIEKAKILLAPLELFAIGFIIYKVRLTATEYKSLAVGTNDFLQNVRSSLYKILGVKKAADIFATEISVIYYGFFGWNGKKEMGKETEFSYHKKSGYGAVVGTFFFLILIETFSLHLVLNHWSSTAAWVLTLLSMYGIIFMFADYNAARKRPILIGDHELQIRIGFRWFISIPLENIRSVQAGAGKNNSGKDYFKLALIGRENIIVDLNETVTALGLYGISKKFTSFGLGNYKRSCTKFKMIKLVYGSANV